MGVGCAPHTDREVVVYTALDEEFARPMCFALLSSAEMIFY